MELQYQPIPERWEIIEMIVETEDPVAGRQYSIFFARGQPTWKIDAETIVNARWPE
jgi:hypothetical protein